MRAETSVLLRKPLHSQPDEAIRGPGMEFARITRRVLADAEAHAVSALLIDVQVEGNAGRAQGGGELQAVLHGNRFVFERVPEKTRRRVFRDVEFIGKFLDQFGRRVRAEQIDFRMLPSPPEPVIPTARVRTKLSKGAFVPSKLIFEP